MAQKGSAAGLDGERPTRKGSRTRERIILAAAELFAENGYHATSLGDIGERAKIQRGALYYHIRAKEELLFEILYTVINDILLALREIAAEPTSPRHRFRQLIICQTQMLLDQQNAMMIYLRDQSALTEDRRERFRRLQADVEAVWEEVLTEGQEAAELRTTDPAILKCVIGLVNSPSPWFVPGGRLSSQAVATMIADLAMEGVEVPSPARG